MRACNPPCHLTGPSLPFSIMTAQKCICYWESVRETETKPPNKHSFKKSITCNTISTAITAETARIWLALVSQHDMQPVNAADQLFVLLLQLAALALQCAYIRR